MPFTIIRASGNKTAEHRRCPHFCCGTVCLALLISWIATAATAAEQDPIPESTAALLWQPSMNVFRRYSVEPEKMFQFYGEVLGLEPLAGINVGNGTQLALYRVGTSQLKFTKVVPNRSYVPGGVPDATGLRLLTLYFTDESRLTDKFRQYGYPAPRFRSYPGAGDRIALVSDPDGQWLELVVPVTASEQSSATIEIGLTVSDIENSRAFYREFVGLEELPPVHDPLFDTMKYPYRHGSTIINLRSFGAQLPADTGSAGIQYVVSDVDAVNALAQARHLSFEQPLGSLPGFSLRTIWLNDPDGITNYFAETAYSRRKDLPAPVQ